MVLHTQYSAHYSIYCGLTDSIVPRMRNPAHDTSDCQKHSRTSPYGTRSWHINHSVGHVHGTSIAVWDTFVAHQSPCQTRSYGNPVLSITDVHGISIALSNTFMPRHLSCHVNMFMALAPRPVKHVHGISVFQ